MDYNFETDGPIVSPFYLHYYIKYNPHMKEFFSINDINLVYRNYIIPNKATLIGFINKNLSKMIARQDTILYVLTIENRWYLVKKDGHLAPLLLTRCIRDNYKKRYVGKEKLKTMYK